VALGDVITLSSRMTGNGILDRDLITSREMDLSLCLCFQTISWIHTASYSTCTGGFFAHE